MSRNRRTYTLCRNCFSNILRQIEMHGARRLSARHIESSRNSLADPTICQRPSRLGQRFKQSMMIDAHLDVPLQPASWHIAGNGNHGRSIQPGAAHSGGQIGGAGPERGYANARYTGKVARRCGHETRGRFAGGKNELNGALSQRFDKRKHWSAGNAENPTYAGFFQHAYQKIRVLHRLLSSDPHRVDDILHRANDRQRGQLSGLGILTGNILDVNVKPAELTFDFDVVAVTQESRNCKDADSGSIWPDAGEAYGR